MNELGILDCCNGNMTTGNVYDPCDFEESPGQGVYAAVNAKFDNSFGEWTHFVEEDRNQHHQCSLTQSHSESSEQSAWAKDKIVESPSASQIFLNSFPMVSTLEDATTGEVEPLLKLLQKSSEPPMSSPALCDAASLWSCLLREPRGLRKPESSGCLNSLRGLCSALNVTENIGLCQSAPAETYPVETSGVPPRPPAGPLIQTKLLAPPHRRDAPSFLYQISRQWVSRHNLRQQNDNHKKGFFF